MLFMRDKEDDDDFIPNPNYNSNLASIFGRPNSEGNPSLTYTPPKQPKQQSKSVSNPTSASSSGSTSNVIVAKTVQTFKMVDGAYQSQGRLGAAVVSINSEETVYYQLLIYRDKRHHLCTTRITRDFSFHIQPKNYCTFYDKQNVIWSILFENSLEIAEFALQVAVAKWKAEKSTVPIIFQDLWCPVTEDPKASGAALGDSVELTYTLSTINNISVPQDTEESQNVLVEVEDAGWKQALVGALPTTKRAIILQPFMLGDLNPKEVVYNSVVVVKMTVIQVNKAPKPTMPTEPMKEEIKIPTNDLPKPHSQPAVTESATDSSKVTKADLIMRMSRMGQALPFKKAAPTPSDSDETEEDQVSRVRGADRAVPKPRTRLQPSAELPRAAPTPLGPPVPLPQHQPPVQWAAAPYMVSGMYPAGQLQSPVDTQSQFNIFLSEVRTTNSELRMGMTRLTDKVEVLHNKIDNSDRRPGQDVTQVLEKLLENEQQLRTELQSVLSALHNAQLSNERHSIEPAAVPVPASSVQPCQRCTDLDQSQHTLSEKVKKLEEENEYLQTSLTAQRDALQNAKIADRAQVAQMEALQKQLEEEQARIAELNKRLEKLETEKKNSEDSLQMANNSISDFQNTLQEKQENIDKLEQALRDSEATKIEEVRRNLQEVLNPKPLVGDHIKKILNAVYRLVRVQFEPQNKYDSAFIQSVLAETIKAVTLEYLQNGDLQGPGEQRSTQATSALSAVGQSQSAPVVRSAQDQQLQNTHHRAVDVESKVSTTVCAEASLEATFSTEQETSRDSLYANSTITPDNDKTRMEENLSGTTQIEPSSETKKNNPQTDLTLTVANSAVESSDDVWRPQPPPPPLFDEEENDDDWLNS